METPQQSSNARLAAVLALIVAFVLLSVIVVSSLSGGSEEVAPPGGGQQSKPAQSKQSQRKVYVVKPGDCCLSEIAQKTGVALTTLEQLNRNLDPQAIHSGDRVKLR